jgi:DNA-binding beta-propeller fold protein YncE
MSAAVEFGAAGSDGLGKAGTAGPAYGKLAFDLVEGWERLPEGMRHLDVASVIVDAEDRVHLFTRHDSMIMVFERDGTFVRSWGEGIFTGTHGLTLGPDGAYYCVDYLDHTLRKFSPDGELLLTLGSAHEPSDTGYDGTSAATVTRSAGPFNGPTACAVGEDGRLYVTDGYGNAAVHVFDAGGTLLYSFGTPGSEPGQFRVPHAIIFTPEGTLAVCDRDNDRIQFFTTEGELVGLWDHLQRPASICLGPGGRYYVPELFWPRGHMAFTRGAVTHDLASRMCVTEPSGEVVARWGGPEVSMPGNFAAPHDVAVDSHGDVYVAESSYTAFGRFGLLPLDNHTLQKFTPRWTSS